VMPSPESVVAALLRVVGPFLAPVTAREAESMCLNAIRDAPLLVLLDGEEALGGQAIHV